MFLLSQATHRMIIQYDPEVGHRFTPNLRARLPGDEGGYFVVTNSTGFRSDHEFEKQQAKHGRILMFGDSYTAGDNVSNADRYSDQLAKILWYSNAIVCKRVWDFPVPIVLDNDFACHQLIRHIDHE